MEDKRIKDRRGRERASADRRKAYKNAILTKYGVDYDKMERKAQLEEMRDDNADS